MKSCPLCGAKATDGAATCFECLYSFSAMSARTSRLVDSQVPASGSALSISLSDGRGRRAVVRAKAGHLYVARCPELGERAHQRGPDLRWIKSGPTVVVEPVGANTGATLNGSPLTARSVVSPADVVGLAGAYMSVRSEDAVGAGRS